MLNVDVNCALFVSFGLFRVDRCCSPLSMAVLEALWEIAGRFPVSYLTIAIEQRCAFVEVVVDQAVTLVDIKPRDLRVDVMKGMEPFVVR